MQKVTAVRSGEGLSEYAGFNFRLECFLRKEVFKRPHS